MLKSGKIPNAILFAGPSGVGQDEVAKYKDYLQVPLAKGASLYVEGELYRESAQAQHVYRMLKSIPQGTQGALGMSVEGGVQRTKTGGVHRAIVRGVAITPAPAHPETLCRLVKSLSLDVTTAVEGVVAEDAIKKGLTESEAIVRLMELRPNYPLGLAKKIVQFVFAKVQTGGIKQ
jgi:hypothetical protein